MIKPRWSPIRQLAVFAGTVLLLEAVAVLWRLSHDLMPFVLVVIPAAAALGVASAAGGWVGMRQLLARMGRWRVGGRWYLAAIGIPVAEKLVVDVVGVLSGPTGSDRMLAALTTSALVVPLVVLVPALLEEVGWRGFGVQTAVDGGHSPAWAALAVGVIFILLHVPLYMPGQLYAGLPFWPLPIILLSYSVLLTWIYLRTRSALLAGLMHASFNATVPLTWALDPTWVWQARAIVLIMITTLVVLLTGIRWWRSSPGAANVYPDQRLPRPV